MNNISEQLLQAMDIYVVFANFFSFRPWSKRFLTKVESPFD